MKKGQNAKFCCSKSKLIYSVKHLIIWRQAFKEHDNLLASQGFGDIE